MNILRHTWRLVTVLILTLISLKLFLVADTARRDPSWDVGESFVQQWIRAHYLIGPPILMIAVIIWLLVWEYRSKREE